MQVLHQSNIINEELSSNIKISSNNQLVTDMLKEAISELSDVQNEINNIKKQSLLLEIKNQQLIDRIKAMVENINCNYQLTDVSTQIQQIEAHDIGISCNLMDLPMEIVPEIPVHEPSPAIVDHEIYEKEEIVDYTCADETVDRVSEQSFDPVVIDAVECENKPAESIEPIEPIKTVESTEPIKSVEPIEPVKPSVLSYSTKEMLIYLSKYKIDFLKFLQCNRNNIEPIAGGCQELIRSFSTNSDNGNKAENRRSKAAEKSKRCKTKSISELKPGVIDTGDHFEDPSLKSSLYDDIDFQDSSETTELTGTVDTAPINNQEDISKIGGEKRINALGVQSKMNFLKSRRDAPKSKKIETWKVEISKLENRHESHYPGSDQPEPIKKERDKHEPVRLPETIFTTRMKDRLSKRSLKSDEKSELPTQTPLQTTTVVKYDLSTSDDPSFQLDSRKVILVEPLKIPVKITNNNPQPDDVSLTNKNQNNREKSKHKHKHSSKKKSKKISKDLEDGEII